MHFFHRGLLFVQYSDQLRCMATLEGPEAPLGDFASVLHNVSALQLMWKVGQRA